MKKINITVYVFEGDRMVNAYQDIVHDTVFNATSMHVPSMLRAVSGTLKPGQEITQVIVEVVNG